MTRIRTIDRDAVLARIDGGQAVLLEALPAMYHEDAHLPGARNMPHDRVDDLAAHLIPDKDSEVIVYCANTACQNSLQAARRLVALGYRNVLDYEAGKQDWIEAGLPTESGPDPLTANPAAARAAG